MPIDRYASAGRSPAAGGLPCVRHRGARVPVVEDAQVTMEMCEKAPRALALGPSCQVASGLHDAEKDRLAIVERRPAERAVQPIDRGAGVPAARGDQRRQVERVEVIGVPGERASEMRIRLRESAALEGNLGQRDERLPVVRSRGERGRGAPPGLAEVARAKRLVSRRVVPGVGRRVFREAGAVRAARVAEVPDQVEREPVQPVGRRLEQHRVHRGELPVGEEPQDHERDRGEDESRAQAAAGHPPARGRARVMARIGPAVAHRTRQWRRMALRSLPGPCHGEPVERRS
jgi:hypothetical protein